MLIRQSFLICVRSSFLIFFIFLFIYLFYFFENGVILFVHFVPEPVVVDAELGMWFGVPCTPPPPPTPFFCRLGDGGSVAVYCLLYLPLFLFFY